MKSREQKQKDLEALTEQLSNSKSAVVVSFTNLTVNKDQEIRNQLREAGAKYQVVKNTLARLAVKGTPYEEATEHFKGVTAIAWTSDEPVDLSKAVSKFIKENDKIFTFKTGIVEGKVVDFDKIKEIANLPSKDELIGKLLYLLNAPAQRLATVLSAIPRDLAVVLQQVSEGKGELQTGQKAEPKEEAKSEEVMEAKAEEPKAEEAKAEETVEEKVSEELKEESTETVDAEKAEEPVAQETEETGEAADETVEEPKQEIEENPEANAEEKAADDGADQEEKSE
jgi:large subunit ribosomal protein L10